MHDNWPHIVLLLIGAFGWWYTASPVLRYMIFLSERDFRYPLLGWFASITASIFILKFSLFTLIGWPAPGTWGSRLFFPILLFASPLVPFLSEVIRDKRK
jgi:hypothetical protein